jgi:hypothetical protein
MARWREFAEAAPAIAAAGRALFYQYGIGLGFLATIRPDGGPRLHPFCPIQAGHGLYGLLIPSPKRSDLLRNGMYAIHAVQPEEVDDEFYLTGTARRIEDPDVRAEVEASYIATGGKTDESEWLFEFDIDRVLLATYKKRTEPDAFPPTYRKWPATP